MQIYSKLIEKFKYKHQTFLQKSLLEGRTKEIIQRDEMKKMRDILRDMIK